MNCPLCAIIKEERILKLNEHSFSTIPLGAMKKGHVMVLPKRHVESMDELNPNEAKDLLSHIHHIRQALNKGFEEDVTIHMNTGEHSSQPHIHFHIMPTKGDMRGLISNHENISRGEHHSQEKMKELRELVAKYL